MPREDDEPSPTEIALQLADDFAERKVTAFMLVVAYEDGRKETWLGAKDSNDTNLLELVHPVEVANGGFQARVKAAVRRQGQS